MSFSDSLSVTACLFLLRTLVRGEIAQGGPAADFMPNVQATFPAWLLEEAGPCHVWHHAASRFR
jgi:hypothetical protein